MVGSQDLSEPIIPDHIRAKGQFVDEVVRNFEADNDVEQARALLLKNGLRTPNGVRLLRSRASEVYAQNPTAALFLRRVTHALDPEHSGPTSDVFEHLWSEGRETEAADFLDQTLMRYPDNLNLHETAAHRYLDTKMFEKALACSQAMSRIEDPSPKSDAKAKARLIEVQARIGIGQRDTSNKSYEEALKILNKAIDRSGHNKQNRHVAHVSELWLRATCNRLLGKTNQAKADLEILLKMHPKAKVVAAYLSLCDENDKDWKKVESLIMSRGLVDVWDGAIKRLAVANWQDKQFDKD